MTEAGWYTDPNDAARARWHDGNGFTEHTVNMADYSSPPPPPQAAAWTPAAAPTAPLPTPPPPPPSQPYAPPADTYNPPSRQANKADAAAEAARAKAMRPWFHKKRFVIPLGILAILVIAGVIGAAAGNKDDDKVASSGTTATSPSDDTATTAAAAPGTTVKTTFSKADDVTLISCPDPSYGIVTVPVQVFNHSSKSSNYAITISVEDSTGAKVGDGIASVDHLNPGQTAKVDGIATVSDAATGHVTCTVADVQRYAAP